MKISFKNDYSEGAHPKILEALVHSNLEQQEGYGLDSFSAEAKELILEKIGSRTSTIHFVSGGTQANLIVISSILRPFESVISAKSGHIFDNETGAIEATGHKVTPANSTNGKLYPKDIQSVLDAHSKGPHQLRPKLVYISNSTELGTIYTREELEQLHRFCRANNLYLFLDGARLGNAITAHSSDVTLADIAKFTDVFYIGGTKNGALLGEAIVINTKDLQEDFEYHLKQKGALLSKGRVLGIQFLELFKNDLYFELASIANNHALRIKKSFEENGHEFLIDTNTNQIFPIVSNQAIEKLSLKFGFYVWKKINDTHSAVRIITSWATKVEDVDRFVLAIEKLQEPTYS